MAVSKIVIGSVIVVIGAGAGLYYLKNIRENQSENIRILAVTPNMVATQVPTKECHQVTTSKKVKNKNSNFFNRMFDSKKHPEYVTVTNNQEVCKTVMQESQTQSGYVVRYQFNDFIESTLVQVAPPLNTEMPLADLQKYQPILDSQNTSIQDRSANASASANSSAPVPVDH
ncbi:hypothetical protein [Aquella oligotrophica]|uniref:Uncharacterized protein n=1 Tax=Aquella oligotrophica TaxID=2067065 RepID=A0A2I7N4M1_9NEIS|nr:hypothetical protein [Aquella oligotrophica]AUR51371.1 hypothetical protein CUN60_03335 [Aquella oligotrophica]